MQDEPKSLKHVVALVVVVALGCAVTSSLFSYELRSATGAATVPGPAAMYVAEPDSVRREDVLTDRKEEGGVGSLDAWPAVQQAYPPGSSVATRRGRDNNKRGTVRGYSSDSRSVFVEYDDGERGTYAVPDFVQKLEAAAESTPNAGPSRRRRGARRR